MGGRRVSELGMVMIIGKNKNNVELFRILFSGMFYNSKSNNRNMMLWEEQFLKGKEVAGISSIMQLVLGDYG